MDANIMEAACLDVDSDPVLWVREAATAAHHAPHLQQTISYSQSIRT
jgi:hypothetical protein